MQSGLMAAALLLLWLLRNGQLLWRRRSWAPSASGSTAAQLRAELTFPRHHTLTAWNLAIVSMVLCYFNRDHYWQFAAFFVLGAYMTAVSLHSQLLSLAFDQEAIELRFWNSRLARLSWSQLGEVDLAPNGLLVLREQDGTRLNLDPLLCNFDVVCAAVLRRAPLATKISPAAAQLLLNQARLSSRELLELYGPRFLADPSIHGYLWDPQVDPYESWREVAATLALRLFRTRGESPDFVLAWEPQGRVRVYPGSSLPRSLRSWARCQRQGQQLRIEVEDQGYGPRNYLQPLIS